MAKIGSDIAQAVAILSEGGLVGIPTETVYGLAGNATNEEAIIQIYEVKKRPRFDPLIAHIDTIGKLEGLVNFIPEKARQLIDRFWPGPLTLLLEKSEQVPDILTSGLDRVAVRMPDHPLTLELLSKIDFPLAAPSANPFGYVSPTQASHVDDQLGDLIPYILDGGPCEVGVESTIIGFANSSPEVHRLGGTSLEAIEQVIGKVAFNINVSSDPMAPGMLKSHYSPGKQMLIGNIEELISENQSKHIGVISFQREYAVTKGTQCVLSPEGNLNEAARNIFKALRMMDDDRIELVVAEYVPDHGLGRAVNDRLRRAASK